MENEAGTRVDEQSLVAGISRGVVQIYSRFFGRGPTKAKTIYRGDLILTVLEEVFTKGEGLLVEGGRFDTVRDTRLAFHEEIEPLFKGFIAELTHREVIACLGQVGKDDIASEVFVLAPVL